MRKLMSASSYCHGQYRKMLCLGIGLGLLMMVSSAQAAYLTPKVTLSVSDMPLEKVCKEIEKQTGYYFVYPVDITKNKYEITLELQDVSMQEALQKVFRGLPFTYQVIEKVIVVNTAKKTAEARLEQTKADKLIKVKGIVLSETGTPLPGASVSVKASGATTLTNLRGEFNFTDIPENSLLIISYIGYATFQTPAIESELMRIRLSVTSNELDAPVIKGYYQTTSRLNTGSVSVVKGADIAKQPVTDPLLALQGRVPGLYIQQTSGLPGSYSSMYLRGMNSLTGGGTKLLTINDPLFIIDGVPFSSGTLTSPYVGGGDMIGTPNQGDGVTGRGLSPFNSINPSDIESIEVLKDADATAIYGTRGGNGVILITTKKGKAGPLKLDLNVYTGIGKVTRTMKLMNTQQYLAMRREAFRNDGQQPGASDYDVNGFWDTTRYTDWQKVVIGNAAHFTNAQVGVSGGSANLQYNIGGGYSKQGTTLPGNYADQKGSLHMGLTSVTPDQRLSTQFSVSYTYDNSNLPGATPATAIFYAPDAPAIYDANHNLNWQPKGGSATWQNPMASTIQYARAVSSYLLGSVELSYKILSNLQVKGSFGYNNNQMDQTLFAPSGAYPPPLNAIASFRRGRFASTNARSWIVEPQVSYQARISKGKLDVLVGVTVQQNTSTSQAQIASGYSSDILITNPMAATRYTLAGYGQGIYKYNAIFGKVNYNWQDKYLLNLTMRRDGSSRFGPGRQFGNFGAIGTAWIFSKENFFQGVLPVMSFGKLRASYGITGNDNVSDFAFMSTYSSDAFSYQGLVGLHPTLMPNPYFAWERIKKLEMAVEMGFLKDKIIFTACYYRNRTDNQLVGYLLPYLAGFNSVQANLPALIQNNGIELVLNTTNIRTKKFSWTSGVNFSVPKNKLLAYPGIGSSTYRGIYNVGQSTFSRLMYHYIGVDPESGVYEFASKNGNGEPSYPLDTYWSKPITQTFYGGISNTFTYKAFQLDIFVQFVRQLKQNYLVNFAVPGSINQNLPVEFLSESWKGAGDIAMRQKLSTGNYSGRADNAYSYLKSSDASISDASFVRLKNLAFSYQLPASIQQKAHVQGMRIFLQCQNLFTFTRFLGLDPETGTALPPMRMITAGLHVTF